MKAEQNIFTQTELDFGYGKVETRYGHTDSDEHALTCRLFRQDLIRDGLVKADWIEAAYVQGGIEHLRSLSC